MHKTERIFFFMDNDAFCSFFFFFSFLLLLLFDGKLSYIFIFSFFFASFPL